MDFDTVAAEVGLVVADNGVAAVVEAVLAEVGIETADSAGIAVAALDIATAAAVGFEPGQRDSNSVSSWD